MRLMTVSFIWASNAVGDELVMVMNTRLARWIATRAILRFACVDLPELETDFACHPQFEGAIERSMVDSGWPEGMKSRDWAPTYV